MKTAQKQISSFFYHLCMGGVDVATGLPPTFHNEVEKVRTGHYGPNPDYREIAQKIHDDMNVYMRDTTRLSGLLSVVLMIKSFPFAGRVVALLMSKDLMRSWINLRSSWGHQSAIDGIEKALRKRAELTKGAWPHFRK